MRKFWTISSSACNRSPYSIQFPRTKVSTFPWSTFFINRLIWFFLLRKNTEKATESFGQPMATEDINYQTTTHYKDLVFWSTHSQISQAALRAALGRAVNQPIPNNLLLNGLHTSKYGDYTNIFHGAQELDTTGYNRLQSYIGTQLNKPYCYPLTTASTSLEVPVRFWPGFTYVVWYMITRKYYTCVKQYIICNWMIS